MPKFARQLFSFVVVGGLAVGVDFVVYFGLVWLAPFIPIPISKAVSYMTGMLVSFIGHRSIVFQATHTDSRSQLIPFVTLYGSSLVANNLVNLLVLGVSGNKLISWFAAICTSTSINYIGLKFGVFREVPSSTLHSTLEA